MNTETLMHSPADIKGYRALTPDEIALMNVIKEAGQMLESLVDTVRKDGDPDLRWLAVGKTHLQEGLMALTRSVAKPTFF